MELELGHCNCFDSNVAVIGSPRKGGFHLEGHLARAVRRGKGRRPSGSTG